jgi:hypothetical protein
MRSLIRLAGYALAASLSLFTTEGLAVSIDPGFDLLKTAVSGSYVDLSGIGIGRVELVGNNNLPGLEGLRVDTIVERKAGCDFNFTNQCTIDIQLKELSLRSKNPVDIGGTFFDVFVEENPENPSPEGSMTITLNSADGGTFSSVLPVSAKLTFVEVGNPSNSFIYSFFDNFVSPENVPWSTIAPPGWPSSDEYPAGGFYPGVLPPSASLTGKPRFVGFVEQALLARHRIPEPATLALFGAGLGLMGWRRRKLA